MSFYRLPISNGGMHRVVRAGLTEARHFLLQPGEDDAALWARVGEPFIAYIQSGFDALMQVLNLAIA